MKVDNINNNMSEYIEINGIKWCKENMSIRGGRTHFQFRVAKSIVKTLDGFRLPTTSEVEALCRLGSTWDNELKGVWLGHDHQLKRESKHSILFPAMGVEYYDRIEILGGDQIHRLNGFVEGNGGNVYYWTSDGDRLNYYEGIEAYTKECNLSLGLPVRLIME